MSFKTNAIRITQNGRVFYLTAIPAGELIKMTKVDVWKEGKEGHQEGYQRAPSRYRKRQIAHYVERDDAVMPIGGLANSRAHNDEGDYGKTLRFVAEKESDGFSIGILEIPSGALPLYVVDMQHRLGGFETAIQGGREDLANFPLPITIADGLSLLEEVDQFDLINTTQKKVRTDLARRLKVIQAGDLDRRMRLAERGKMWEAKGPVIASNLNGSDGIWKGRIMPPNSTKRDCPNAIIKETSFVTSLKPILQTPYFSRLNEKHSSELIGRYWAAIAQTFPQATKHPQGYVIMKTPGVFSLHQIAPEVFELARDKRKEITVPILQDILKALGEEFKDEFWENDNEEGAALYGSMKGFRILASKLREHLPTLSLD